LSKEDLIPAEGVIIDKQPNAFFKVQLDNSDHIVLAQISGKVRRNRIRILMGDRVAVEMSPYDLGEFSMDVQVHVIGERAEKLCAVCNEERGHVVTSINKRGQINRVDCPKCGTRSTFKRSTSAAQRLAVQPGSPYDRTRTYRAGQTMAHPIYGEGEVTALIEPQKIDVLFSDRLRRLIHSQVQTFAPVVQLHEV
jgi:translation initiation factor IF-1